MNRRIEFVRWFNYACPWNKYKHVLSRWGVSRLTIPDEPRVFDGIQGGLCMRLDLTNEYQRWLYLHVYELVSLQLLRRLLKPGDAFVDGGANIGLMTLVADRCVGPTGRVHAFEPQPEALDRLRENLQLNDAQSVSVIPKGCWDRAGTSSIFTTEGPDIGKVSMRERPSDGTGDRVEIETVRIDEAVPGPVKLIKLDIEGAELHALRGADRLFSFDPPPHVIMELNLPTTQSFGYHPIELADWILQRRPGYRLHLIKSKRHVPIDRDDLARLIDSDPRRHRNIWFEPPS